MTKRQPWVHTLDFMKVVWFSFDILPASIIEVQAVFSFLLELGLEPVLNLYGLHELLIGKLATATVF